MGEAIGALAMAVGELTNENPVSSANVLATKMYKAANTTAMVRGSSNTPFTERTVGNAIIQADYIASTFALQPNLRAFDVSAFTHAHDATNGLIWALPKTSGRAVLPIFLIVLARVGQAVANTPSIDRRKTATMWSDYATNINNTFSYVEYY